MKFTAIYLPCVFICIGYGITFPLFAIMIHLTGVSGVWIGINATLPAFGWIIGSLLVPIFQIKCKIDIKFIASAFLLFSVIGLLIPIYSSDFYTLSITRFLFGGSIGVFLRCVEYILVANTSNQHRGKYLATYGAIFMLGMIVGSIIQPELGSHLVEILTAGSFLVFGLIVFMFSKIDSKTLEASKVDFRALSLVPLLPIAFLSSFVYALYESVPAYFLQIFALRSGFGETTAAYTLSAAALGNLLLLYPLLMLSDKIGRTKVLGFCVLLAATVPFALKHSLDDTTYFLALVGVLGASAGVTYGLSLAMIGDRFSQASLVLANALFGIFYSIGSIFGPLFHGLAMEMLGNNGLLLSIFMVFSFLLISIIAVQFCNAR